MKAIIRTEIRVHLGNVGLPELAIMLKYFAQFLVVLISVPPVAAADPIMEGPPIGFYAVMTADEESASTESPGTGRADFLLDRATTRLSWKVTYKNTTSPVTGAHIHGPQRPGTNAGVQFDMAPNGLKSLPLEGSAVLTDAQLEYLLSGRMYVNIHTTKYPEGELRGQIERVAPGQAVTN